MRRARTFAAVAAIGVSTLLATTPLAAQVRPATLPTIKPLVTTEWLQKEIARPDLVILQIGPAASFAVSHVPGAVPVDYGKELVAPSVEGGLQTELPSADSLRAMLARKGVTATSRVVLVFDSTTAFARAGRAFFTLEWGGLAGRVAILDGGLAKWKRERRYVAAGTGRRVAPTRALALEPSAHLRATKSDVVAMVGQQGMRIVDARDTVFYQDLRDNQMPRGGHIASAVSLPFSTVTNADGTLRSRAELEALVRTAGIQPDETVTAYCHIGVQASWMYFAMRVLGRDVRVYDGSFDEWSRDAGLPVEGARARPAPSN